jgi:hypothetical protein
MVVSLLLCNNISNATPTHSWDFKSATGNVFVDTIGGAAQNIPEPLRYIANDYGVHLAFEVIKVTTADIFQDETFTIYGAFYSHTASSYYLFCEQNGAIDRFCLSVTASGYYAITMVNSLAVQQYKISSILARTGQIFFSIQVSHVMGYTQMVLNIAHENNTPTKLSEILTFDGVYLKSSQTFNIGCKVVNSVCTEPFYGSIRYLIIDDAVVLSATLDALYSTTCLDDTFLA